MEAGGRVISDLADADAAGAKSAVLDLDGADDQHFALMAAPATARDRIVFAAARDFGFINLDEAGQGAAARGEHAAAQLGANQPRRLVGAESELTLQLQSRDAIGVIVSSGYLAGAYLARTATDRLGLNGSKHRVLSDG